MYMAEVQKVMNSMNVLFFCPNVHWWCLGCFSVYQSVCWELAELRINVLILHWYTQGMKICEDMGIERKLPWVRSNKHILKMIISGAFCVFLKNHHHYNANAFWFILSFIFAAQHLSYFHPIHYHLLCSQASTKRIHQALFFLGGAIHFFLKILLRHRWYCRLVTLEMDF